MSGVSETLVAAQRLRLGMLTLAVVVVSCLAIGSPAALAAPRFQLPGGLTPAVSGDETSSRAQASSSDPDWLSAINYWRQAAGLAAVTDQSAWDLGMQHHFTYLEDTPASYRTGQYASLHTENPQSPYYTSDGATEGADSDLEEGVFSNLAAIDGWLTAPFHAIGMLRAQLTQVAFAEDSAGYAGLDVIQGVNSSQSAATSPILYPGPGSTTTLPTASDEESPDPLQTCGWQGMQVGLPLIALLTQAPAAGLTASVSGPTGAESTANGGLCVVDANTFQTTDPVYGPTGLSILQGDKAVLLIPRTPLADGSYSVDIQQPSQPDIEWSFTAAIPTPTNVSLPQIGGSFAVGAQLTAYHGQWTNSPSTYADQWLRCDSSGANCTAISGATGSTYTATSVDGGATIRVQEIASNSGGPSSPAVSSATSPIYHGYGFAPYAPGGLSPAPGGPSPTPGGPSPTSGSPHTTTTGSKSPPCRLCVSASRPVALVVPSAVARYHSFTLSFAGRQRFSVDLGVATPSGHRLWHSTRHLHAGRWTVRVRLPRAAAGRGKTVLVTARFALGIKRITLRGAVRFR